MDKTKVMVEFRIIGHDFEPDEITIKLLISPKEIWKEGEKITGKSVVRKYTCWTIGTEYEESIDIDIQLNKVISLIKDKRLQLIELKQKFKVKYRLDIVINIENNEKPAIYLNSDIIEFANEIKAEFDFDLYIYS